MTQDQIILMADASGISLYGMGKDRAKFIHYLEAFAKLVAQKAFADGYEKGVAGFMQAVELEREACARIVEVEAMQYAEPVWTFEIVNDIRARGQA